MLDAIREKSKGWITWAIVGLICVVMALFGVQTYFSGQPDQEVVATVGNQSISKREYQLAIQRVRLQQMVQAEEAFNEATVNEEAVKQLALQQLINAQIQLQAAKQNGFVISDEQLKTIIVNDVNFHQGNQFSEEKFKQALSSYGYSFNDYLQQLRVYELLKQSRQGIAATAIVTNEELASLIQLFEQTRDFRYLRLSSSQLEPNIEVKDETLRAYYQQHQAEFTEAERVAVAYLKLTLDDLLASVTVSEQQIDDYYRNYEANYQRPARWQVAHILTKLPENPSEQDLQKAKQLSESLYKQLQQGADFTTLVHDHSEDRLSAKQKGQLPWFTSGDLGSEVEQALEQLSLGEYTQPIKTRYGYEIIQLIDKKPSKAIPLNEVVDSIRETLTREKAQTLFVEKGEELAELAYANPESLAFAAQTLGLTIQKTGLFDRKKGDGHDSLTNNPLFVEAAFEPVVLNEKENSPLVTINSETMLVLRMTDHKPAYVKAFEAVKPTILKTVSDKERKQLAEQKVKTLVQALKTDPSNVKLLKPYETTWETILGSHRHGDGKKALDEALLTKVFSLTQPTDKNEVSMDYIQLDNGHFVIVQLLKIYPGNTALPEQQNAWYKQQLEQVYGMTDYQLFLRDQVNSTEMKMNLTERS